MMKNFIQRVIKVWVEAFRPPPSPPPLYHIGPDGDMRLDHRALFESDTIAEFMSKSKAVDLVAENERLRDALCFWNKDGGDVDFKPSKHYAHRDLVALGDDLVEHSFSMTREGLFHKYDIAAELAHRDRTIRRLRQALQEIEKDAKRGLRETRTEPLKRRSWSTVDCWLVSIRDGAKNALESRK